jgi:uncharacterized protein
VARRDDREAEALAPQRLNARRFFYAQTGELLPPWRLAIFFVATLVCLLIASVVVAPQVVSFFSLVGASGVTTQSWVTTAGLVGGTAFSLRVVDKRPWSDVWLGDEAKRPRWWIFGFIIGCLAIGVPTAALVAGGWLEYDVSGPGSWWGAMVRLSLFLMPAALTEELMTRGYIMRVLRDWWGWSWAIVATSVAFGLLHWQNAGASPQSLTLVTLAGLFLVVVLIVTRSLYAAWMAHFAWNWMLAAVFHTEVSGLGLEAPGYRFEDAGPDWATGGVWGPEGGVAAAIGMLASIAFLWRYRARIGGATTSAREPDAPPRD